MERRIYTIGKMSGIPYEKQMGWRNKIEHAIRDRTDGNVVFIHPPLFYNFESMNYHCESEIKEFDLAKVQESDIVVVNLDQIESSVGSIYEIATACAMNDFGNKHIFVIGIGDASNLHPWIQCSLTRCEKNIESAADYISTFLLV